MDYSILDFLPVPVTVTNKKKCIQFINKSALKLLNKNFDDCVGKHCCDIWQSEICDTIHCGIESLKRGESRTVIRFQDKIMNRELNYITDQKGEVIGYIRVDTDITNIGKNSEKINSFSENIPSGIFEISLDEDLTLLYGSKTFYALIGWEKRDFLRIYNNKLSKLIIPQDLPGIRHHFDEAIQSQNMEIMLECRIIRRDGSIIWVLLNGNLNNHFTKLNGIAIDITERKKEEQDLKLNDERLRVAMEKTSNIAFDYDVKTKRMIQPPGMAKHYLLPQVMENVPDSIVESGVISEDSVEDFLKMYEEIAAGVPSASCLIKTFAGNGEVLWIRITITNIFDDNQNPVRAIGLFEDMTKQKEIELAYFQEEQYRHAMLSDVILYMEMNITKDRFEKRKGEWSFQFDYVEDRYSWVLEKVAACEIVEEYKQGYVKQFHPDNVKQAFTKGICELSYEYMRYLHNGAKSWMKTTITVVRDIVTNDIKGFMYVRDIDARKKEELQLEYASTHDILTDIYNKAHTERLIKELLKNEPQGYHAFIIMDLDCFKSINDTYGHYVGDKVLAYIAGYLKTVFMMDSIIGRVGGDEFVVFIKNLEDRKQVEGLCLEFCEGLMKSIPSEFKLQYISCSVGVAMSRPDSTFEELYQNADKALYEAKKLGKNQFVFYQPVEK